MNGNNGNQIIRRHLDNIVILCDNINTEREKERAEGIEEGEAIRELH